MQLPRVISGLLVSLVLLAASGLSSLARADDADFSGTWNTKTDKGWTYVIEFAQDGSEVSGTYVAMNGDQGEMSGTVDGNQLELTWTQGEFEGTAQFSMSSNNKSFTGIYTAEANPQLGTEFLQGTWSGKRASPNTPTGVTFAGSWITATDKGWQYLMILSQKGNKVTGTYQPMSAETGKLSGVGTLTGQVKGRVLKFDWDQEPDFVGTGQFTMAESGDQFAGVYRSDPHPDLPPEFLQGTWTGRQVK